MKTGLDRARALAKAHDYAKDKADAEATVARWEWATAPRSHPQPAYYEMAQLSRGAPLDREPSQWKLGQAHEGFDAEGRIVVIRERGAKRGDLFETFFRYARTGVGQLHYGGGTWIQAAWHTIKGGRIVASDSLTHVGGSSREYEYDARGHVIRCIAHGVHADEPWERTFEFGRR